MDNKQEDIFEKRIRFLAKHYQEDKLDEKKAWEKFSARTKVKRVIPFRRYLMAVASVALILLVVHLWYVSEKSPEWVVITTGPGEIKEICLADSSYITLAENSQVTYDAKIYGKSGRALVLEGKAYMEAARDEARPFSVQTHLGVVTVLGTSFQVNDKGTSLEVEVYTGKVRLDIHDSEKNEILTAGMSARYGLEDPEIYILTEEHMNSLSWKTKQLRFENTPVEIVIADLSEYYHMTIVNKKATPGVSLTATFKEQPLEEVLLIINQTLDIRLEPLPNN
ncbi:MAG: FecR domain-containing protein [Tannerellaceae bacterium]|nr:FecR domain-containing protein [Tannerellaceae bacterium]